MILGRDALYHFPPFSATAAAAADSPLPATAAKGLAALAALPSCTGVIGACADNMV